MRYLLALPALLVAAALTRSGTDAPPAPNGTCGNQGDDAVPAVDESEPVEDVDLDTLATTVKEAKISCGKAKVFRVKSTTTGVLGVTMSDGCAGTDSIGGLVVDGKLFQSQTFPDAMSTSRTWNVENGMKFVLDCRGGGGDAGVGGCSASFAGH